MPLDLLAGGRAYNALTTAIALAGLAVAVLATVYGRRALLPPKRQLNVYPGSPPAPLLATPSLVDPNELKVTYQGAVLVAPHVVSIALVNTGRHDITSTSFDSGRPIRVDLGAAVVKVLKTTTRPPRGTDPTCSSSGTELVIDPSLFSVGQEFLVQVLTSGQSHTGNLEGHVKHDLTDVRLSYRNPRDRGRYAQTGAWLIVLIAVLATLLSTRELIFKPVVVTIDNISETGKVLSPLTVSGRAELPEGAELWVLVRAPDNLYYLLQSGPAEVGANDSWSVTTGLGRSRADVGRSYEVVALGVRASCATLLRQAADRGRFMTAPPRLETLEPLEPCLVARASVRVQLSGIR